MTEKYYDIYFDPAELEVDGNGELENWDALYIHEYNEDGKLLSRVDYNGKQIAFGDMSLDNILELYHVGHGDDILEEALTRFSEWLSNNTEWKESSSQTYWQPAEYRCVGISGYTFDLNEFWHPDHRNFFYLNNNKIRINSLRFIQNEL